LPPPRTIQGEAAKQMLAEQYEIGAETIQEVSLTRLLDESPWLQFTSECQRFGPPPRLINQPFWTGGLPRRAQRLQQGCGAAAEIPLRLRRFRALACTHAWEAQGRLRGAWEL
jgi:hypothetical protein